PAKRSGQGTKNLARRFQRLATAQPLLDAAALYALMQYRHGKSFEQGVTPLGAHETVQRLDVGGGHRYPPGWGAIVPDARPEQFGHGFETGPGLHQLGGKPAPVAGAFGRDFGDGRGNDGVAPIHGRRGHGTMA